MITHYIVMSSSYSQGKRIALHYIIDEKAADKKLKNIKSIINIITEKCGKDVSISTHFIQTDSTTWDSVYEKDYFFKDVEVIDSLKKFIKLIQQDRTLLGIDVARYILSRVKCTHLKLEKLVYLCFADYLCKYDKELFQDVIYAYKYGPVVRSVYERYKSYSYKEIDQDDEEIVSEDIQEMPSRSRIIFAENGLEKINSIDETIEKYAKCTAGKLVELTHKPETPWAISGKGVKRNEKISNKTIKLCHCNEEIND